MRYVFDIDQSRKQTYIDWLKQQHEETEVTATDVITVACCGYHEDGTTEIFAVAAFHSWRTTVCEVTLASDLTQRWKRHNFFWLAFDYVFNQNPDVMRISSIVNVDNVRSAKATERIGFKQDGLIRSAIADGHDAILFGFTRNDWRNSPWAIRNVEQSREEVLLS